MFCREPDRVLHYHCGILCTARGSGPHCLSQVERVEFGLCFWFVNIESKVRLLSLEFAESYMQTVNEHVLSRFSLLKRLKEFHWVLYNHCLMRGLRHCAHGLRILSFAGRKVISTLWICAVLSDCQHRIQSVTTIIKMVILMESHMQV